MEGGGGTSSVGFTKTRLVILAWISFIYFAYFTQPPYQWKLERSIPSQITDQALLDWPQFYIQKTDMLDMGKFDIDHITKDLYLFNNYLINFY